MISIYSWNVNGIRAIERKGLWKPFLEKEKPDIICLQETKANKEQIDLHLEGYDSYWFSAQRPGYSGTAIITKMSPLKVVHGFPESILEKHKLAHDGYGHPDEEGRVIAAEFDDFWLVSVYTPNAKDDLSRIPLREKQWDPAFLDYCKSLEKEKPVVFCGDLNVAHTEEDLSPTKT
jgi:exodeoxyribonuclease-3